MICKDCGGEMEVKWEELFGRLWICKKCLSWFNQSLDKELPSGMDMDSPNMEQEGGKIA